ncbi:MAG TPA: hypothetical protein VMF06_22270 [Candidatus Limnocylindria bacterium]|jgi:glycerophosphoryl diester phosphodiesterase|nr:hypothetical protein [Candidatus Limnocylindria bacterium]
MTLTRLLRWSVALVASALCAAAQVPALWHAHSHNDYEHEHPLFDALAQGFTSVEADIHLQDGELIVAHSRKQLRPERTLRALYLEPLRQIIRTNHGRVHLDRPGFYLMLDYKGDDQLGTGEAIHQKVCEQLAEYADILTKFDGTNVETKAVTVTLSGSRPEAMVTQEKQRWWALDGKIEALQPGIPASLTPWVSLDWADQFKWKARAPITAEEEAKLKVMVGQAHAAGRIIRFWGAPDNERFWECARRNGVDLVNTDKLHELAVWTAAHPALERP